MAAAMSAGSAARSTVPTGLFASTRVRQPTGRRRPAVGGGRPGLQPDQADEGVAGHRPPGEELGGGRGQGVPLREQLPHRHAPGAVDHNPQGPVGAVVEDQEHPSGEVGVGQAGAGHQQLTGQLLGWSRTPVGLERAERFHRHPAMMAQSGA